jgi:hypothetical protein
MRYAVKLAVSQNMGLWATHLRAPSFDFSKMFFKVMATGTRHLNEKIFALPNIPAVET